MAHFGSFKFEAELSMPAGNNIPQRFFSRGQLRGSCLASFMQMYNVSCKIISNARVHMCKQHTNIRYIFMLITQLYHICVIGMHYDT